MAWGNAWGTGPCHNARVLAKAFFAGRPRRFGESYVTTNDFVTYYFYRGACIAQHTPESALPNFVAHKLAHGYTQAAEPFRVCTHYGDKGEARHLQALGIDAKWQYGKLPFLIFGVEATGEGRRTIDEWKALPKWAESVVPKTSKQPKFINLTLPLFA